MHELVPVQQDLLNEHILHRVGLKVVRYVIHYLVVVKVQQVQILVVVKLFYQLVHAFEGDLILAAVQGVQLYLLLCDLIHE